MSVSLAVALALAGHCVFAAQRECIGHHTIELPGSFEYALVPSDRLGAETFSGGLPSRGVHIDLRSDDGTILPLTVTQRATEADLKNLFGASNAAPQHEKDDLLGWIKRQDESTTKAVDPSGEGRKFMLKQVEQVSFYEAVPGHAAFVWPNTDRANVFALVNDHILIGKTVLSGKPEARVEEFLSHFRPRPKQGLPAEGGACIPFFRVVGDRALDSIGVSMRLIDQPDIVVTLQEDDATSNAEDPKKFIVSATQPGQTFVGSVQAKPLDRIKATQALKIDGREGLGAFAEVKREGTVANTSNQNLDWAFIGYVPGQTGLKPGQSHNIVLKVERFGRFARQPMTEAEFRSLVKGVAEGIRHRDTSAAAS